MVKGGHSEGFFSSAREKTKFLHMKLDDMSNHDMLAFNIILNLLNHLVRTSIVGRKLGSLGLGDFGEHKITWLEDGLNFRVSGGTSIDEKTAGVKRDPLQSFEILIKAEKLLGSSSRVEPLERELEVGIQARAISEDKWATTEFRLMSIIAVEDDWVKHIRIAPAFT